MSEFYSILTIKGENALYEAISTNNQFNAFYMAVGDSAGNYYEPEVGQTALKNEKYRAQIYKKGKRENYLYFDLMLPPSEGDYTVREVGLFSVEDELLGVAKYPETLKKKASNTENKTLSIEFQIYLSKDAFNTVIIDNSGNLATDEKIEYIKNEINSNKANVGLDNLTRQGEIKLNAPKFCFNFGPVDENGEAALLEYIENEENQKIILKSPSVYTDGFGVINQINADVELDVTDLDVGVFDIQIKKSEDNFILYAIPGGVVTYSKKQPQNPNLGDLWQDLSVEPTKALKFNGQNWEPTNCISVGKFTKSDNEGGGVRSL